MRSARSNGRRLHPISELSHGSEHADPRASFDAVDGGDGYNNQNCQIAASLFQGQAGRERQCKSLGLALNASIIISHAEHILEQADPASTAAPSPPRSLPP